MAIQITSPTGGNVDGRLPATMIMVTTTGDLEGNYYEKLIVAEYIFALYIYIISIYFYIHWLVRHE